MKNYQQIWLYECTNPECGIAGIVNDVVLNHRYKDGVPCPYCGQEMQMVREAIEAEYDPEMQDALAAQEMEQVQFKLVPPSKAFHYAAFMSGQSILPHPKSEDQATSSSSSPQDREQRGTSDKEVLTEQDVARILDISVTAVQRLVREKKLGFIQLTKRKKAFTQELIDEFIRRESRLPVRQGTGITSPLLLKPNQSGISIEESREILRKVLKTS